LRTRVAPELHLRSRRSGATFDEIAQACDCGKATISEVCSEQFLETKANKPEAQHTTAFASITSTAKRRFYQFGKIGWETRNSIEHLLTIAIVTNASFL
jgi:hypothetical protein